MAVLEQRTDDSLDTAQDAIGSQPWDSTVTKADEKDDAGRRITDTLVDDPLLDKMIRRPTEEDFEDVLTVAGNSGDIVGSGISDSTGITNGSLAGTG